MGQLYTQRAVAPDSWDLSGAPATTVICLAVDATINYSDGSADTLPANTPAVLPDATTAFDRTHDVYVPYTVQGSGVLSIIKESLLPTLTSDYAPLARVELHGIKPYQPQAYLASGGLGSAPPAVSAVCLSSTAARCQNVTPSTDSADTDYPGWSTAGFDDSAWAHALVAHSDVSQAFEIPSGAQAIDDLATRPSTEGAQKLLVRQTFVLPGTLPLSASLSGGADAWADFWVNGTHIGQAGTVGGAGSGALSATDVPVGLLVPGGTNVVAVQLQDIARTSAHNRFCAFALSVSYPGTSGVRDPGSNAEGDLLYYHAGAWTNLPIGTSGQDLTVVAGDPAWATPSGGSVTSVQVAVPAPLSSSGGPITASGTITLAWASGQTANRVLASPNGSSGAVSLRALVGNDIPVDASTIVSSAGVIKGNYQAGSGVSISGNTISATGSGGSVTSVALSVPGIFSLAGSPITTSGTFAVTLASQSPATVFAGPASGSAAAPTFRALQGSDLPAAASAGGHIHAHGHFL